MNEESIAVDKQVRSSSKEVSSVGLSTPSFKKKKKIIAKPSIPSKGQNSKTKGPKSSPILLTKGDDECVPVQRKSKEPNAMDTEEDLIKDLEGGKERTFRELSPAPGICGSLTTKQPAAPCSSDQTMLSMKSSGHLSSASSGAFDSADVLGSISSETKEAILRLIFSNHIKPIDLSIDEADPNINHSSKKFLSHSASCTSGETESISLNSSSSVPLKKEARPIMHDGAYFTGIYIFLIILTMAFQTYKVINLTMKDGFYYRLLTFAFYPLFFAMVLFPFRIAFYNVLTLFGSWRNVYKNSRYHSAIAPPKVPRDQLPPVCIQMPVYKESFVDTIQPSLDNIQRAIEHYKEQGGQAFIFINDDGLQLVDDNERQIRMDYFLKNNIAYVARPAHSILPRHGLFKKASNMNFCLNFAMDVANIFFQGKHDGSSVITSETEVSSAGAIQEAMKRRSYPVLAGGPIEQMKSVQFILLVDSDTRVPETCLYDTVGEFVYDEEVGFLQHATSVLRVDDNYWEELLAHFTNLLYSAFIPLGTALGEPSPLVGHNATLNWRAIQEVSWYDEDVGYRKYWSESHVSEDFDLSMRLQSAGYIGRYALYTGDGFQEGVSVTVHDEIKKLKKYAYGSGEMLFNPFKDWCCKGPISPLLCNYLKASCIPWHARINVTAYLFNYVAMFIGVAVLPLSFYVGFLDPNNLCLPTAWQVMIGTSFIFGVVGTLNAVLFTLFLGHHQSFPMAFIYEVSRMLPLSVFFVGLSYHVFTSLGRYMLSLKAEWGATVKELDSTLCHYNLLTFFSESIKAVRAYWDMYVYLVVVSGLMAFFFLIVGPKWDVSWSAYAASPFCLFIAGHAVMPIILNPIAMRSIYYPIRNSLCCIFMCPSLFLKREQQQEPQLPTNVSNAVPQYVDPDAFGNAAGKHQTSNSTAVAPRRKGPVEVEMDSTSHVSMDSASEISMESESASDESTQFSV